MFIHVQTYTMKESKIHLTRVDPLQRRLRGAWPFFCHFLPDVLRCCRAQVRNISNRIFYKSIIYPGMTRIIFLFWARKLKLGSYAIFLDIEKICSGIFEISLTLKRVVGLEVYASFFFFTKLNKNSNHSHQNLFLKINICIFAHMKPHIFLYTQKESWQKTKVS